MASDDIADDPKMPRALVEKRGSRRARLRAAVEISSVTNFLGLSTNVSLDGICVFADEELPVDSLVDLEFEIPPGKTPIDALGEVMWKRPIDTDPVVFSYGIKFLDLDDNDRRSLTEIVERHTSLGESSSPDEGPIT